MSKIEKIQERSLRILFKNYAESCEKLLEKSRKSSTEIKRLHALETEIFKTLSGLNPDVMKNIFILSTQKTHKKCNLEVPYRNSSKYGNKSLKALGAHIKNSLPKKTKLATSLASFKNFLAQIGLLLTGYLLFIVLTTHILFTQLLLHFYTLLN